MSTVYLHVGMPKTGTTAIQCFLSDNADPLKKHGICFPDFSLRYYRVGYRRNAHFLALPYIDEEGNRDHNRLCADYEPVMEQIEALGKEYDKIILADEALWRARGHQPEFWKNFKADLKKRGLGLCIIVYLRRQDTYMESLYRQKIKEYATKMDFHTYLEYLCNVKYPFDYASNLDMFSDIVGKENLFVRVYEKEQYKGEEKNIFSDFLDILGISLQDGFEIRQAARNISIDGTRLAIQKILNTLSDPPNEITALAKGLRSIQNYGVHANDNLQTTLFGPGEAAEFLGKYAESNERVAREYLGRDDGVLFYDTEIKALPQYSTDVEALLDDTILFYGTAVQTLEHKNRMLEEKIEKLEREIRDLREDEVYKDMISYYENTVKLLHPKTNLENDFKKLQNDMREIRENVILYRLKRKIRHLSGKDK